jgi:hypothetical protein
VEAERSVGPATSDLERLDGLEAMLGALSSRLDELRAMLDGHGSALTGHSAWLADLQKWMTATVQTVSEISTLPATASPGLQTGTARLLDPAVRLERQMRIWTVMTFLAQAEVPEDLRISVVLPTKNRRAWLERAVASVTAQTYSNWELLVVDDASDDDTASWLAGSGQPRIRTLQGAGTGAAAARNVGLEVATGDIVTYLDDDNAMHPGWLKAIAWAFSRWTDTESLYGARIIEDDRTSPVPGGAFPSIEFLPYDRERLERGNFIDQNVLAHRAAIPEARQDPGLSAAHDWDVALKLTGRRPPLELPVVACIYTSSAPERMSETSESLASTRIIRARVHTTRALRIVAHSESSRPRPEIGREDDLRALRAAGASVTLADPRSPDLQQLVSDFKPDLILAYDTDGLDTLEVPFAVRALPSASDHEEVAQHRLCIGVWSLPDETPLHAELSEALTRWRLKHV